LHPASGQCGALRAARYAQQDQPCHVERDYCDQSAPKRGQGQGPRLDAKARSPLRLSLHSHQRYLHPSSLPLRLALPRRGQEQSSVLSRPQSYCRFHHPSLRADVMVIVEVVTETPLHYRHLRRFPRCRVGATAHGANWRRRPNGGVSHRCPC